MTRETRDYHDTQTKDHQPSRPPALLLHLVLEEPVRFRLEADTYEDEQRLRTWLRGCSALRTLGDDLARLLDDLDEAA
jgi:hypothetical protein